MNNKNKKCLYKIHASNIQCNCRLQFADTVTQSTSTVTKSYNSQTTPPSTFIPDFAHQIKTANHHRTGPLLIFYLFLVVSFSRVVYHRTEAILNLVFANEHFFVLLTNTKDIHTTHNHIKFKKRENKKR